jgi:UDP-N-acetylglucosamine:LPS N-acetylglucosamine transferase
LEILKRTDQQFLVYGYNTAAVDGNLTYRVFSDRMPEELSACKAVMGTAGMSLMSEAVWLKKPFFGIPLKNEFEQMWNAVLIRQSNFGDFSEEPTKAAVDHFFQRMNEYRRSLEDYRFDPDAAGKKLLELIEGIRGQRTNELAARDLCARRLSADLPRAIVIAGVRLVTPVTSRFLSPPG